MIRRIATVALTTIALGGAALSLSGTANAENGNPAGETLEHCTYLNGNLRGKPAVAPCVDTKGWGVRVKTASGKWTKSYGPESYSSVRTDGRIYYTFDADAKPYGKAKTKKGVDY